MAKKIRWLATAFAVIELLGVAYLCFKDIEYYYDDCYGYDYAELLLPFFIYFFIITTVWLSLVGLSLVIENGDNRNKYLKQLCEKQGYKEETESVNTVVAKENDKSLEKE